MKSLWVLLLAGTMMLSACGGGTSSSGGSQTIPLTLSGNWQFNMAEQLNADPTKPSFRGGLQGGLLLQTNDSITGSALFSIITQPPAGSGGTPSPCNNGTDQITGTISGQTVTLTAASTGAQTYTLTGTLSFDGSTMTGTYTSTDGAGCGIAVGPQTTPPSSPQAWSATLVPPLTGSIQGSFYSAGGAAGLNQQDFLVSGALTQGADTGAGTAVVTGNLNFLNTATNVSDYPCFALASVSGYISGNTVALQILGTDQTPLGQIGEPLGEPVGSTTVLSPVILNWAPGGSAPGGSFLQGAGTSYLVATTAGPCIGSLGSTATAGDFGNLCLVLNGASACQQPVTLTPSGLKFLSQAVDSSPTKQTITLADPSGAVLTGLTLGFTNNSDMTNYTEQDNCVPGGETLPSPYGQTVSPPFPLGGLLAQQFCTITISFAPLETCASGAAQCPSPLTATLSVNIPNNNMTFTVPITGTGVSSDAVSTSQRDFGAGRIAATGLPRLVSFSSQSPNPAQTVRSSGTAAFADAEHHAGIY